MGILAVVLVIALMVPVLAILFDSPIGRALARRLGGPEEATPGLTELARKVEMLEAEVDDLTRGVQSLREDNTFLQRLLGYAGFHKIAPIASARTGTKLGLKQPLKLRLVRGFKESHHATPCLRYSALSFDAGPSARSSGRA